MLTLLPSIPGQPKLQLEFMSSQQLSNGINAMTALERGGQAKSVTTRISQLSTKENGAKLILLLPEFITHLVLFSLNEQSFLRPQGRGRGGYNQSSNRRAYNILTKHTAPDLQANQSELQPTVLPGLNLEQSKQLY